MEIGTTAEQKIIAGDKRHTYLCAAIGTPLDQNECLHVEGLRAHLEDQAQARVDGVLVAGTMGAMPLLTHRTYEQLVRAIVAQWTSYGEVLVGVGDLRFEPARHEELGLT